MLFLFYLFIYLFLCTTKLGDGVSDGPDSYLYIINIHSDYSGHRSINCRSYLKISIFYWVNIFIVVPTIIKAKSV